MENQEEVREKGDRRSSWKGELGESGGSGGAKRIGEDGGAGEYGGKAKPKT